MERIFLEVNKNKIININLFKVIKKLDRKKHEIM